MTTLAQNRFCISITGTMDTIKILYYEYNYSSVLRPKRVLRALVSSQYYYIVFNR